MSVLYSFDVFKKNYCLKINMALILCIFCVSVAQLAYASENVMNFAKLEKSSQTIADASEYMRLNQNNMRFKNNNNRSYGGGSTERDGYIDVYTDPKTGDRVTKVVPPKYDNTRQQDPPIIIYPTIDPSSYLPGQNIKPTPVPPVPPIRPIPIPKP